MRTVRISDRLRGTVWVEIFGAYPAALLNAAAGEGVELWDARSLDANTLRLRSFENRLPALEEIARRGGCELRVLERAGGAAERRLLLRRPGLLIGLAVAAALLTVSTLFVWDVDVRGTESLSRAQVLRALEDSGFGVGSFWPGVNTDILASEVMLRLPEIAWMTVNVSGSRAVTAVVERAEKPEMYGEQDTADLVASRGGLIRHMNVLEGAPAAAEGQLVTEGQLLVSGDLESLTGERRRVRARGSIMADTWYELNAVRPAEEEMKTLSGLPHSRFALVFGKRRVNLYIGSGKTIDGCDKIISEYTLGLDGLFSTPVRLVRERFVPYKTGSGSDWSPQTAARRLYALLGDRIEGQILSCRFTDAESGGLRVLTLRAHCTENIARTRERSG